MRIPRTRTWILALAAACSEVAPARANFVIGADHPPIGAKGYALQTDNRLTYVYGDRFVNANGTERDTVVRQRLGLFILRLFVPNWMVRASIPYVMLDSGGVSRYGWGDAVFEAGASRDLGPDARLRALLYAKAPFGAFQSARAANIGAGQWDVGPNVYLTRYLWNKSVDVNGFLQYVYRANNTGTNVKPGNELSYAVTAARLFKVGVPMRLGVEHRGLFGDPNTARGRAVGAAKRQLSVGPAAFLRLDQIAQGFSLWPTALFDVDNRNTQRVNQYYLKIQYNY